MPSIVRLPKIWVPAGGEGPKQIFENFTDFVSDEPNNLKKFPGRQRIVPCKIPENCRKIYFYLFEKFGFEHLSS